MPAAKKWCSLVVLSLLSSLSSGQSVDDASCGVEKGCFKEPSDCETPECDYIVTWTPDEDAGTVAFELEGKTEGWVAVGFSTDQTMGEDSVYECLVTDSGDVLVQTSYNEATKGQIDTLGDVDISDTSGRAVDDTVQCSFTRPITATNPKVFSLNEAYYLLLGVGPVSGGQKGFHNVIPSVSADKLNVVNRITGVGAGGSTSPLLRAHGILMMSAWTMFVCTAILLARYFKEGWPGKKLCDGMPIWFSLHRILNTSVLALTVIAFILIFVDVQGYSPNMTTGIATAHPIIGIIVTALAIANPLMALFRPHPDGDRRPIFNWAHWTVGTIANILAFVNVFLGMSLPRSDVFLTTWAKYISVAFALLYAVVVLVLEIHSHCCVKTTKKDENYPMQQPGEQLPADPPQGMMFRYAVFTTYVVLGCVLYVIMLVIMLVR